MTWKTTTTPKEKDNDKDNEEGHMKRTIINCHHLFHLRRSRTLRFTVPFAVHSRKKKNNNKELPWHMLQKKE